MRRRRVGFISVVLLVLLAVLSHLPELALWHDCNPLPGFTGLAVAAPQAPWAGSCFIDGNAGLTLQAFGHRAAEDWLSFHVPWWNPYAGIGMPLAAEMQPAAFFLPFILLLHFANGLLLLKIAAQLMAGICMLFCLRCLGFGRGAALFGALLYELDGTFAWYGDAPMLPLPFLPLLVGGIEQARRAAWISRPNSALGGMAAIAGGIGFSLLAGFPETAFLNGLLAAIWAAMSLLASPGGVRRRMATTLLVGGLVGLALAAPALISFLDYLNSGAMAFRGMVSADRLGAGQEAVLLLPALFGAPYSDFAPDWAGLGGYLGAALMLPGLVGLFGHGGYRQLRGLAAVWTLFWLAVFLGEPVSRHVWQAVPVLNQAVVTRYAMPSIAFLWTVLAALGWQRLRSAEPRAWIAAPLFVALCTWALLHAMIAGRIHAAAWPVAFEATLVPGLSIAWTLIVVGTFALLTWRPGALGRLPRAGTAAVLAALLLCDALASFVVPQLAGAKPRTLDLSPVTFLRAQPGFVRSYALDGLLEPNYGSYFGIPTLQAFSLPAPKLWVEYAERLDPRVMGEMFKPSSLSAQAARLQSVRALFEDAGVGFVLVPPDHDPLAALHDPAFALAFSSVAARIYRLPGVKPYFDITSGGPCMVAAISRMVADVTCNAPAILLRRELFDAGWHATLGGTKTPVVQADGVFQAVMIPAGMSRVHYDYVPAHRRLMAGLLATACILLSVHWFRLWRARLHRPV